MKCRRQRIGLLFIYLFALMATVGWGLCNPNRVVAESNDVDATVKVSICGNGIIESGEDCDGADLAGKNCTSFGYTNGTLACDSGCSLKTSGCVAPVIDPANVLSGEVGSLLAAGYFTIPSVDSLLSTSSLTATAQITIKISENDAISSVILPDNVVISKTDGTNFDPMTLTASLATASSLSGFASGQTVDRAIQFGIAGTSLQFSLPITLSLFVGTSLNGQTLTVVRSISGNSGWTSDGIVSPATCTVAAGSCSFQATKASYFATNRTISSTQSSSGSTNSNTSTTSNPAPASFSVTPPVEIFSSLLPPVLRKFYAGQDGKISADEISIVVKSWVDAWKQTVQEEVARTGNRIFSSAKEKCDINGDGGCDLKDFSVLLYYVDR